MHAAAVWPRPSSKLLVAEAEVALDDARVGRQVAARPGQRYFPGFQDVAVVGDVQRGTGVLLDQQDGDARLLQLRR